MTDDKIIEVETDEASDDVNVKLIKRVKDKTIDIFAEVMEELRLDI